MNGSMKHPCNPIKRDKKMKKWSIASLVALSLFVSILQPTVRAPGALVGAETISNLTEQQKQIQAELAALKKEKEALKNETKVLEGELSWLNSKTAEEKQKYEQLVEEKNNAYLEMENALAESESAAKNVVLKQEEYRRRLQVMFENRNKGTLEMLLDAKDLKGFLANTQLIAIIAESDQKVLDELNAAKDEALLKKTAAEKYCLEMQAFVERKNAEIEALKNNLSQTQEEIAAAKAELAQAEKDEAALLKESNLLAAEIKRLQSAGAYYGGTMVWPTPGYTSINPSNGFGMRWHPIYHYWRMHSGIDINAPFGSKIVSAAAGRVIVASTIPGYDPVNGNNYGGTNYGNYIIIDHGGGISSVYAHCKLLKVKTGDTVQAGEWIAVTGSTGLSTGAHLHFEIRENGTPVNPLQTKYLGVKS